MALYAWLLHVGGQGVVAARILDDWITKFPEEPVLTKARSELSTQAPQATGVLTRPPWRMAPNDGSGLVVPPASVTGSAILTGDGCSALTPANAIGGAQYVWVRSGLGQTVTARVSQRLDDLGLVALELEQPLETPKQMATSPEAPFAGSPSYLVEFAASEHAEPAWPTLRQGFFTRHSDPSRPRPLGIGTPPGPHGGPVFDRSGHLAGIAVEALDGKGQMVPIAAVLQRWPEFWPRTPPDLATGPVALDALYEAALRATLQVIVPSRIERSMAPKR
jgi:hypothetical protein